MGVINIFNFPPFTGRNVPLAEIAQATGKSVQFLKRGLKRGIFKFGYAVKSDEDSDRYTYFCPERKVWEEIGYFNPNPDKTDS